MKAKKTLTNEIKLVNLIDWTIMRISKQKSGMGMKPYRWLMTSVWLLIAFQISSLERLLEKKRRDARLGVSLVFVWPR